MTRNTVKSAVGPNREGAASTRTVRFTSSVLHDGIDYFEDDIAAFDIDTANVLIGLGVAVKDGED